MKVNRNDRHRDPPRDPELLRVVAIGLPLLSVALLLLAPIVLDPPAWERVVHDETGAMELLTIVFLLPAAGWAGVLALGGHALPKPTRVWFGLLALGALYFMGEEASWGQHLLGFEPPAAIAAKNLQGEFNLHNADAWYHDLFNEVPRTLAGIGCVVGAGVLPWVVRSRRADRTAPRRSWFWMVPTVALVLPGLLAWASNLPEKALKDTTLATEGTWAYYAFVAAADETKEYLIAMTMMLYAWSASARYRRWSVASPRPADLTDTAPRSPGPCAPAP